jgi:predicted DNA-binding WGR domain protein
MAKTARTFEFNDGKSSKFWTINVSGNSYTVTYGRIGTNGQTTTKEFDSADACTKPADKVIKEKLGKGYVEKK